MMIQSTTIYHLPITNDHCASGTISTTVESALQIRPFLTNKANFRKSQMNISTVLAKDYEQRTVNNELKNKPNSNPIQTQTKPIAEKPKMNVNKVLTKNYENKPHFWAKSKQTQNKPNTNPTCSDLVEPISNNVHSM